MFSTAMSKTSKNGKSRLDDAVGFAESLSGVKESTGEDGWLAVTVDVETVDWKTLTTRLLSRGYAIDRIYIRDDGLHLGFIDIQDEYHGYVESWYDNN